MIRVVLGGRSYSRHTCLTPDVGWRDSCQHRQERCLCWSHASGDNSHSVVQCNVQLSRVVEQFKYLGNIFVREGGYKEDVKTRCLKAAQVFYLLSPIIGHKEISMITKTHIIKAVFTPTLLCQSENWTLTSKERQMLTTTEMSCLRKNCMKGQNGQD